MAGATSGIRKLRYLQWGKETTAGTTAAATTIWRGSGVLEDKRVVQLPKEDVAILGGVDRTYIDKLDAAISLDAVPATFEQLPYLFEAGVKTVGTGGTDGTGSGKIYAYPMPTTAKQNITSFSLEGGDDQQGEVVEYCHAQSIKLAWKAGEAVMMSGNIVGRQVTNQAKTGALNIPTVEEILGGKGALYIDTVGGTAGTTLVSNTLVAGEVDITTGWEGIYTVDNLFFSTLGFDGEKQGVNAKLTFLYNGSAVTEKGNWRTGTARLLQLSFTGTTLTTGGTYTAKTLKMVLPGKWIKFDKLGEQNGNDIVVGTFESRYDPTAASGPSFTVVNSLATLP